VERRRKVAHVGANCLDRFRVNMHGQLLMRLPDQPCRRGDSARGASSDGKTAPTLSM
jgi:hypothetical protein